MNGPQEKIEVLTSQQEWQHAQLIRKLHATIRSIFVTTGCGQVEMEITDDGVHFVAQKLGAPKSL